MVALVKCLDIRHLKRHIYERETTFSYMDECRQENTGFTGLGYIL